MTSSPVMHFILSVALVAFVVLSLSVPVLAQPARPERPYRGLFGSGVGDVGQVLDVQATLSSGYDDDLIAEATGQQGSTGLDDLSGGVLHGAAGEVAYRRNSSKVLFSANGGSSVRYYPSLDVEFLRTTHGRVATSLTMRERTTLSGSMSAVLQPYSYGLLFSTTGGPGIADGVTPDLDQAVTLGTYLALETQAGITQRLSQRVTLSANYGHRVAELPGDDDDRFSHQNASGQLSYAVGKGLSLRAGYGYGESRYAGQQAPVVYHSIDAGVDYNRALSFSRRTRLSFGTGTTAARVDDTTRYVAIGNVTLTHEIGRTWQAAIGYTRNVEYYEVWSEPVLSDAATATLVGLLNRRVEVTVVANAARGTSFTDDTSSFSTYYGRAGIQYAATRFMRVGAFYTYYHHDFDNSQFVLPGVPRLLNRQSVRATVTFWAPLFTRARRVDAAG